MHPGERQDAWNTCDPALVARGYSADSYWRNRAEFVQGQPAIKRKYRWDRSGPRPIDHPSLSELGL